MPTDWRGIAAELWRGLPGLSNAEADDWAAHSEKVGQPLTREGLELWMLRVQTKRCVVCGRRAKRRFCRAHETERCTFLIRWETDKGPVTHLIVGSRDAMREERERITVGIEKWGTLRSPPSTKEC